jgi:Zinc knuckle
MSNSQTCYYCQLPGHKVRNCPSCPSCFHCGKKGHKYTQCFRRFEDICHYNNVYCTHIPLLIFLRKATEKEIFEIEMNEKIDQFNKKTNSETVKKIKTETLKNWTDYQNNHYAMYDNRTKSYLYTKHLPCSYCEQPMQPLSQKRGALVRYCGCQDTPRYGYYD